MSACTRLAPRRTSAIVRRASPTAGASTLRLSPGFQPSTSMPNTCAVLAASLSWNRGSPEVSAEMNTSRRPSIGAPALSAGSVTANRTAVERCACASPVSSRNDESSAALKHTCTGIADSIREMVSVENSRLRRWRDVRIQEGAHLPQRRNTWNDAEKMLDLLCVRRVHNHRLSVLDRKTQLRRCSLLARERDDSGRRQHVDVVAGEVVRALRSAERQVRVDGQLD